MNTPAPKLLVVDNFDSFVYTIVSYLEALGASCRVLRNDVATLADADSCDGVLISPGPGNPVGAGVSMDMIRHCADTTKPMLGVCLGHQALAEVYGATVGHAPELMHGKVSQIQHDGTGVFAGLPEQFTVTRYHSLAVDPNTLKAPLRVTATTADGVIMALCHTEAPLQGVQFHPESILSEHGHDLFRNWLDTIA